MAPSRSDILGELIGDLTGDTERAAGERGD